MLIYVYNIIFFFVVYTWHEKYAEKTHNNPRQIENTVLTTRKLHLQFIFHISYISFWIALKSVKLSELKYFMLRFHNYESDQKSGL